MKVLLTTLNTKYVHTNIALRYLEESLKQLKQKTEEKRQTLENKKQETKEDLEIIRREFSINDLMENLLAEITDYKANVIAFSVYIWNVEMTLKLAKQIKQLSPDIKIILGGPEVSYRSKELLEEKSYIDYICVGEGEEAFPNLIHYIQQQEKHILDLTEEEKSKTNDTTKKLKHITYRNNNDIIVGELACVADVTKIPRISQGIADEYDGKIVYIETVRGCPYNCSYCLSSTIKGIRPFPMDRVKDELKILIQKEVKLIKFVDRTFNYDKKRALEIWKFILENNISSQFHFELSAHLIDDEMIEFLKTVPKDVFKFEIGVQSTNPKTISAINRTTNFEILSKRVKQIAEMNTISLHLDLIAGLPYEDIKSFQKSFDDVYNLNPTELQLGFLKMLSGTQIRNEEEKFHYVYTSYPPYEILQNDFVSYEDLKQLKRIETVFDFYYNSARFQNSLNYILKEYESAFDFYNELTNYFKQNGLFERKISVEEQYDILAKFYQETILLKDNEVIEKILIKNINEMKIIINNESLTSENEKKDFSKYDKFIQYLKYDFVTHFNTKREWMTKYDSKWLKKNIDEIVAEMLQYNKEENIYKNYKFEVFEIDLQTGERKQNILVFRR